MGGSCGVVVPRLFLPATIPGGFPGLDPDPQGVRPNEIVGRYRPPVDGTGNGRPSRRRIVVDVSARRTSNSDRCQEQQHRWDSAPYDHPSGFSGTQTFRRPEPFAHKCWVGAYLASATRPVSRAPWPATSTSPAPVQPRISAARFPCRSVQQFTQDSPAVGPRSGTRGTRYPFDPARRYADFRGQIFSDLNEPDAGASDFPAAQVGWSGEQPYACRRRRCSNDCMSRRPAVMTKT